MQTHPKKIVLASNNSGKLKEFSILLGSLNIECIPQAQLKVADIEETGLSFIENAILKARHASQCTGLPAIADDSGLEVDALNGAPGIYSARFSQREHNIAANDSNNIDTLLKAMTNKNSRNARYQCVLAFMQHAKDPTPIISQGTWQGIILESRQGEGGFGYDPIFYCPQAKCSAAQLHPNEKHALSHRAKAMQALLKQFKNEVLEEDLGQFIHKY